MATAPLVCGRCEAEIFADAPEGLCTACLFETRLSLLGDSAGAKVTAEQARNTLEQLFRDQPDNADFAAALSQAYAMMGEKGLGPKGSGACSHASADY